MLGVWWWVCLREPQAPFENISAGSITTSSTVREHFDISASSVAIMFIIKRMTKHDIFSSVLIKMKYFFFIQYTFLHLCDPLSQLVTDNWCFNVLFLLVYSNIFFPCRCTFYLHNLICFPLLFRWKEAKIFFFVLPYH